MPTSEICEICYVRKLRSIFSLNHKKRKAGSFFRNESAFVLLFEKYFVPLSLLIMQRAGGKLLLEMCVCVCVCKKNALSSKFSDRNLELMILLLYFYRRNS